MAKRKGGREVDDRKVLSGVNFYEDNVLLTVDDPDELESRASADDIERWKAQGVIRGDAWDPQLKGKDAEPQAMPNSRMARAKLAGDDAVEALKADEAARAERKRRREEMAEARRQAEAGEQEAAAEEHAGRHRRREAAEGESGK